MAVLVRVREGFGKHFQSGKEYKAGESFEFNGDTIPEKFRDKLELVPKYEAKGALESMHPCGKDISDQWESNCQALADVAGKPVQVYQKGRRYRILVDQDICDTEPPNIVNHKQLQKAFKNLLKEMKAALSDDAPTEEEEEE